MPATAAAETIGVCGLAGIVLALAGAVSVLAQEQAP
jgi:hypothetical protein